jgi:hypothetical protein
MMTDIVTFPCEYLVICSGYEYRLLNKTDDLFEFCADQDVVPLFVTNEQNKVYPFLITDGRINPSGITSEELNNLCVSIHTRLLKNDFAGSYIVFRVSNFSNAISTASSIKELNYCAMYDIFNIVFLCKENKITDIAFFNIDAESG